MIASQLILREKIYKHFVIFANSKKRCQFRIQAYYFFNIGFLNVVLFALSFKMSLQAHWQILMHVTYTKHYTNILIISQYENVNIEFLFSGLSTTFEPS